MKSVMPNIKVVTEEEAEAADMLVCCRTPDDGTFSDNLTSTCSMCGHNIYFRPHVPKTPPKICMQCMLERLEATVQ